jgi:hypothetical protein
MRKLLSTLIVGTTLSFSFAAVNANPSMPPFYADVMKMTPEGKLGSSHQTRKNYHPSQGCTGLEDCLYFIGCCWAANYFYWPSSCAIRASP